MRRVLASALVAFSLSASAVAAAPADLDAWVKTAQQRLDKVLGEPVGFSSPGTRIGEVRMHVDAQGNLSGFELIRSTGSAPNDEVVMDAARDMGRLPPPPASVMGHPVVVRVSFITPTSIQERYGLPELKPYVYIEESSVSAPQPK
ncbi:energy transducer TonB [Caulobacter sp. 17J65-9]|uniref:energy transducer TonB family protein n=1 Tax=Caulobacter sp. 17J65-9 TaxID=2709382 RepID=UPI0013CC054A|nr:energy transducer TonB [Caulobacter sp. 17J65-9]NEX93048.1 energy transducer TonB [Caulobacter sp. 17J65-9]